MPNKFLLLFPWFVLIGSLAYFRSEENGNQEPTHPTHSKYALLISIISLFLGYAILNWDGFSEEPLLMFEGVSSIPTFYLQFVVIMLAGCFCIIAIGRLQHGLNSIKTRCLEADSCNTDYKDRGEPKDNGERLEISERLKPSDRYTRTKIFWEKKEKDLFSYRSYLKVFMVTAFFTISAGSTIFYAPSPLLIYNPLPIHFAIRVCTIFCSLSALFICTRGLYFTSGLMRELAAADDDVPEWSTLNSTLKNFPNDIQQRCLRMKVIVNITQIITPLVYLPCILIGMLLFARSSLFEGWIWTPGLVILYLAFIAFILFRAIWFQKAAVQSRNKILKQLYRMKAVYIGDEHNSEILLIAIDEIKNDHRGAFAHWSEHPIFRAIALPSGSLGLLAFFL